MGLGASTVQQHCRGAPVGESGGEQLTGKELVIHPAFASSVASECQEDRIRALHLPEHLFRIILKHLVSLDEPRASVQSVLSLSATSTWLGCASSSAQMYPGADGGQSDVHNQTTQVELRCLGH